MSSDGAARADALVAKADKRLKGWSLMGNKYEDAQEMLEKAANLYDTPHHFFSLSHTRASIAFLSV